MRASSSTYYVRNLLSILEASGVDRVPLLREARIRPAVLEKVDGLVPMEKFIRLLELCETAAHIPALGLKAGIDAPIGHYDSAGYISLIAPTLEEAIQRFRLSGPKPRSLLYADLSVANNEACLSLGLRPDAEISDIAKRHLIMFYAGILSRLSDLIGLETGWLKRVEMPFPADGENAIARELLSCPVHWNSDCLRLSFPADLLSHPVNADELMRDAPNVQQYRYFEQQYGYIVNELSKGLPLTAEINRMMIQRSSDPPDIDEIARVFGVTRRTLQRQLEAEGTSYREILSNFRMVFARFYLEHTTFPASEIGYLLGYKEHVNFYRAFKAYFGKPPGQLRETGKRPAQGRHH